MNAILEQINSAGSVFVRFALPMLVQSSVLIVVLLIADLLLRKKVRAVVRYWFWMLVLIKLVLPTTLSSPVSLSSWFGDKLAGIKVSDTSIVAQPVNLPQITEMKTSAVAGTLPADFSPTVTSSSGANPVVVATPLVSPAPLTWQGIVFLVWAAIVTAMGLLLLQRAIFVTGLVAQAQNPTQLMNDAFRFSCGQMGIKGKVSLKVSANTASPAVCGLFRPMILVPQNLAPTLGSSRLRMVFLHELAHIKRGDLWINLVQTISQIVYFYNPLLWMANSIIRRIREQAVDEAVQVAMGANAPQYPQTLLDVAKIAFNRPILSLRLIGVVESKSALKGRIERMLNRPIPKSSKLGVLGLITLLIFAVVLLPMSKATEGKKGKVEDAVQFTAKLNNGVTVKLIGVCEHPSEGKQWWRPDGTVLKKAPYSSRKGTIVNSNEDFNRLIEIAVGLSGTDLQDVSLACKVLGATKTSANNVEIEGLKSIACEVSKLFSSGQVDVGVAAGSWETIGVQKADIKEIVEEKVNGGFITWDVPLEKRGEVAIKVAQSFGEYDFRVIAKDRNGNILKSPWSSGGGADALRTTEYRFPVHLAQIDEFQFQTRPYQWIEFKNVSLRPGVKTNVQVEIEGASKVSDKDKMASENLAAQGWELWRQRKLPEAEEAFEKAISKDPTNANAWNGLGWAQQNQGKPLNAKASFEKCLEIQPKHAAALNGLGWIAKAQGKTDEAIAHWEKAIEVAPAATAALNGLATTYMELKQFDKAAKYYKMWLNVEPDNTNAKTGLEKTNQMKAPHEEHNPVVSVYPPSGSKMALFSELQVVFNQPMMPEEFRIFDASLEENFKNFSDVAAVRSYVMYDADKYQFSIPLILPCNWNGSIELSGFKTAKGAKVQPIMLDYTTLKDKFSDDLLQRFEKAKQSKELRTLLENIKNARSGLKSLSETVYYAFDFGDNEKTVKAIFKMQGGNQFYVDMSEEFDTPWHIGSDGEKCWFYNEHKDDKKLVALDFNQIAEKKISICNPFEITDADINSVIKHNNIEYLGTETLDGRKCYKARSWLVKIEHKAICSIITWWFDSETYMPAKIISDSGRWRASFRFVYDRINEPIKDSEFRPESVTKIKPQEAEPLDENYNTRFVRIIDGSSSGRMSIRWGKHGPKGTSSSGLN